MELERSLNAGNSTASSRAITSTENESKNSTKSDTIEKKIHKQDADINDGSNDSPKILTALLNQSTASHFDLSNKNKSKSEKKNTIIIQNNHHNKCQICNKEFRSKSSLKV